MSPFHGRVIDAWMQHPTPRFRAEPMFEPLRRWFPSTNLGRIGEVPLASTIDAMDAGGVRLGLVCAWWGPVARLSTMTRSPRLSDALMDAPPAAPEPRR